MNDMQRHKLPFARYLNPKNRTSIAIYATGTMFGQTWVELCLLKDGYKGEARKVAGALCGVSHKENFVQLNRTLRQIMTGEIRYYGWLDYTDGVGAQYRSQRTVNAGAEEYEAWLAARSDEDFLDSYNRVHELHLNLA